MIVGGGAVPATSLTRHEVQRPRPPQIALMSTPPAWAAFRMVVPGLASRTRGPGRMVSEIAMRAQDSILFLDFTRVFADSYLLTRHMVWAGTAPGGCVAQLHRLSPPLAGSDAPRDGARHLPGDARHAGQPARSSRGGGEPAVARRPEEPRRGLRARQAALRPVRHLPGQGHPG